MLHADLEFVGLNAQILREFCGRRVDGACQLIPFLIWCCHNATTMYCPLIILCCHIVTEHPTATTQKLGETLRGVWVATLGMQGAARCHYGYLGKLVDTC